MIKLLKQEKNWRFITAFLIILIGAVIMRAGMVQSITIVMDGESYTTSTAALTVSGALRSAGFSIQKADRVIPSRRQLMWNQSIIYVDTAVNILVKTPAEEMSIVTAERIPANILHELKITLYPQDRVMVNGETVDPRQPLDHDGSFVLQYEPATLIRLKVDGLEQMIYTSQLTLGAALGAASVDISPYDWISEDLSTAVDGPLTVSVRRARPVTVRIGETTVTGRTAASTVGDALLDMGLPLQNLDASQPDESEPVPEKGAIEVVRIHEDVIITTDEVAYDNDYVSDPETLLDEVSVIEPGQVGISAARERVRYANGEEIQRVGEGSWQASEPQDGILGYGTQVQIRTEVLDGITIEYWRKLSVYAVSYKPCDNQGVCHDGTAGGYPLQKGIIAVSPHWYSVPNGLAMADLNVYVPGYGGAIVGDTCGGCSGQYMIDLAYRPEDYVSWHEWTTLYFLTPVPDIIAPIITP